jgi:hypothetical protein
LLPAESSLLPSERSGSDRPARNFFFRSFLESPLIHWEWIDECCWIRGPQFENESWVMVVICSVSCVFTLLIIKN